MRIEASVQTGIREVASGRQNTQKIAPNIQDKVDVSFSKLQIDAEPSVRMDRIDAVRSRLASGFYDRADVREGIAEAFLKAQFS